MIKVAVFVEGMTEQEFVIALVTSLVGNKGLHVALGRQWKGKVTITPTGPVGDVDFFVLVIDCASDEQVKTQVRDQYPSLVAAGYTTIIGLRDVYPFDRADIEPIRKALIVGLPTAPLVPQIHLAVMEVEAWFISETTHFPKIDDTLTLPFIVGCGFDIVNRLGSSWDEPARTLDSIYKLANKSYLTASGGKKKNRVLRTLRAMSIEDLYVDVRQKLPELDGFISSIETALFPPIALETVNPL